MLKNPKGRTRREFLRETLLTTGTIALGGLIPDGTQAGQAP